MPTTRRKSVATSKAKGKAPPATPKPKDTPGIPHIVSSSTTTEQHKHGAKSTSTKTIITETVVQQSRVGGQASYSPLRSPSLADELDPWEVLPKTGYTYAQSPSYSQLYLNCDDWVVPNMSRPRIRGGAPLSITPSSSSSMSSMGDLLSVSQANVHTQHGGQMSQSDPVATEGHMRQSAYESRQAALQGSYMGHISTSRRKTQNIRTLDKDYEETLAYEQSLPTSVTRSGRSRDGTRRSTRLRDSTSRTDADMTDMTVDEYMQLEKQMEYSGHAGPRKESSRLSLYGLDRADEIEMSSDTEVTHIRSSQSSRDRSYQVNSSSSYTVITSYMWSLVTTIVTICSTVVETSWNLATTPVRWLASSAETTSETETSTVVEAGTSQDGLSTSDSVTSTQTTTQEATDFSNAHDLNVTDKFSDDETALEVSRSKSAYKMKRRSTDDQTEDTTDDESWLTSFLYVLIAVAYVLFIAAPAGIFKAARTSSGWLFAYLLMPIVDGASSMLYIGYSTIVGSVSSLHHLVTTSTVSTVTTISTMVASVTEYIGTGFLANLYTSVGYYGNMVSSALYTTTQMLAVLIWTPVAAITSWAYYGYLSRWCWSIGVWIHGFAARILLLDVWLLSSSRERRRGACCCLLPLLLLLLLLPFLVPASRYIFTPITKTQSGASLLVSEKVEAASAAGISGIALREIIEQELAAAKVDLKTHGEHLYADNLAYIERLEKEIERQGVLLAGLKDCCKNDTALVGLIRDGVHHQLAAIMQSGGSDAGAAGGVGGSTNKEGFSNAAFVTWLNTQFSESSDFDAKIAALTATLNQGLKEQADAAKAAMLAAVQAEQAAKDANGESNRAAGLAVSVQEAQGTQGAAWTKDKAHLEGLIAGVASDLKNIDDRANSAAIAAAAATDTANTAAVGASTAVAQAAALAREQAESQSAAAAAGIGVGSGPGCGCDSQNVVLPDNYQTISEDQVKLLIREALGIFGADKTGMVDYALESAGGSVISTRCSETYHRRTAQLSLFGIPLWYMSNSPRTVIQPDVQPGQCWAFKGTEGYMVIQLAGWVKPNAFSMEHIPKVLSPTGKIDSAPKDFTVWGLQYERDTEGVLLGNYTYLDNGEPLQFFTVRDSESDAFHVIELRIHSNHGNQEYTCLYRFRVHGVLKKT